MSAQRAYPILTPEPAQHSREGIGPLALSLAAQAAETVNRPAPVFSPRSTRRVVCSAVVALATLGLCGVLQMNLQHARAELKESRQQLRDARVQLVEERHAVAETQGQVYDRLRRGPLPATEPLAEGAELVARYPTLAAWEGTPNE